MWVRGGFGSGGAGSDVDVVAHDGLHAAPEDGIIDFLHAAAIGNFELFVTLGGGVGAVSADADTDAAGDFGGGDGDDVVAEAGAFAGGDGDASVREEESVSADDLQELALVDIPRVDLVVVDDGAQPRAGEGDLSVGEFLLDEVGVIPGGKGVLAEVIQPEESRKAHAAHAAAQGALLGVEAVGVDALVPGEVQGFVGGAVVGFLEDSHVVHAA